MRYIFTAAVCTLCAITAILALPPIGGPHAVLVAQTHGDRSAIVETSEGRAVSPRQMVTPSNAAAPSTNVLGSVELAMSDDSVDGSSDPIEALDEVRSLAIEADEGPVSAGSGVTSSTSAAPTTTTEAPETNALAQRTPLRHYPEFPLLRHMETRSVSETTLYNTRQHSRLAPIAFIREATPVFREGM